jgi:hypothetical protein
MPLWILIQRVCGDTINVAALSLLFSNDLLAWNSRSGHNRASLSLRSRLTGRRWRRRTLDLSFAPFLFRVHLHKVLNRELLLEKFLQTFFGLLGVWFNSFYCERLHQFAPVLLLIGIALGARVQAILLLLHGRDVHTLYNPLSFCVDAEFFEIWRIFHLFWILFFDLKPELAGTFALNVEGLVLFVV